MTRGRVSVLFFAAAALGFSAVPANADELVIKDYSSDTGPVANTTGSISAETAAGTGLAVDSSALSGNLLSASADVSLKVNGDFVVSGGTEAASAPSSSQTLPVLLANGSTNASLFSTAEYSTLLDVTGDLILENGNARLTEAQLDISISVGGDVVISGNAVIEGCGSGRANRALISSGRQYEQYGTQSLSAGGNLTISGNTGAVIAFNGAGTISSGGAIEISGNVNAGTDGEIVTAGWNGGGVISAVNGITVSGNTADRAVIYCASEPYSVLTLETTGENSDIVFENNSGRALYAAGIVIAATGKVVFSGNTAGAETYTAGGWYNGGVKIIAGGDVVFAGRGDTSSGALTISAGGNVILNGRSFGGDSTTIESGNVLVGSYDAAQNSGEDGSTVTLCGYWQGGKVSFAEGTSLRISEGWTLYINADGLDALGKTTLAGTLDLTFQHTDKVNIADLTLEGDAAKIISYCKKIDDAADGARISIGKLSRAETETGTAEIAVTRGGIFLSEADAWSVAMSAGTGLEDDASKPGSGAIALGADAESVVNLHASSLTAAGTLTVNGVATLDEATSVSVAETAVSAGASLTYSDPAGTDADFGSAITIEENALMKIGGDWTPPHNETSVTNAGTLEVAGTLTVEKEKTFAIAGAGDGNAAHFGALSVSGTFTATDGADVRADSLSVSDPMLSVSGGPGKISLDAATLTIGNTGYCYVYSLDLANGGALIAESGNLVVGDGMYSSSCKLTLDGAGTLETRGENSQIRIGGSATGTTDFGGALAINAGVTRGENGDIVGATGTLTLHWAPISLGEGSSIAVNAFDFILSSSTETDLSNAEIRFLKNVTVSGGGTLKTAGALDELESVSVGDSYNVTTWMHDGDLSIGAGTLAVNGGATLAATGDVLVGAEIAEGTNGTIQGASITIDLEKQTQGLASGVALVAKTAEADGTETLGTISFTGTYTADTGRAAVYNIDADITARKIVFGDGTWHDSVFLPTIDSAKLAAIEEISIGGSYVTVSGDLALGAAQTLSFEKVGGLLTVNGDFSAESAILIENSGAITAENVTLNGAGTAEAFAHLDIRTRDGDGTLTLNGENWLAGWVETEDLKVTGTTTFAEGGSMPLAVRGSTDISGTLAFTSEENLPAPEAWLGEVRVRKEGSLEIGSGRISVTEIYSQNLVEIGEKGTLSATGDITTKTLALNGGAVSATGDVLVMDAVENASGSVSGADVSLLGGVSGTADLAATGTLLLIGESEARSATAGTLEVAGTAKLEQVAADATAVSGVLTLAGSTDADAPTAQKLGEISGAGTLVITGANALDGGLSFADGAARMAVEITAGASVAGDIVFSENASASVSVTDATLDGNIVLTGAANALTIDGATLTGTLAAEGGALTLSGENAFLGGVKVSSGTRLAVLNAGALGADTEISLSDGAQLDIGTGTTLNEAVISVTLGEAYLSEAAIAGTGGKSALGAGTAILVGADAAALDLIFATAEIDFLIFDADSVVADDATVSLSEDLLAALDEHGWDYVVKSGVLTLGANIPEPSAFGFLAGAFALALATSRRCRNKRRELNV